MEIARRYELIAARLELPETYNDPAIYAALGREQKELAPLVEAWEKLRSAKAMEAEARALLDGETDPELRSLAKEELAEVIARIPALEDEIKFLLLPTDPDDGKSVIVEIRAGVGGEESALFAADLYRMYSLYAESQHWNVELANVSETDLGGFREISFILDASGAYARMKFERGFLIL